ncbi:MAG: adenylosuccinate synthase [Candidatus Margulisiibacteriota bacterium]
MTVTIVVGSQWGDEGKGKITDLLSKEMDMVVRYQGGNNAGHTVVIAGVTYKLHLIPSGIFYPSVSCVIGNGVVIDPAVLLVEIESLKKSGQTAKNLFISSQAHMILPYHKDLDAAQEKKHEAGRIGTTCRGIGPCYVDKFNRRGIRIGDFFNKEIFRQKLEWNIQEKSFLLNNFYNFKVEYSVDGLMDEYFGYFEKIKEMIVEESTTFINDAIAANKRILMEGAQGTMLDVDHGTYPYVTSSNPISGGACVGAGFGPQEIDEIIGVAKAYFTRVGDGPFPTEIGGELEDKLREIGKEFGTTTGRPRRCGWFDGVVMRHAAKINGLTQLAITKLDVLDSFDKIKVCTSYEYEGKTRKDFPTDIYRLAKCKPVYEELPGWKEDLTKITDYKNLPVNAKKYLDRLAELSEAKVSMISVGADRAQIIRI